MLKDLIKTLGFIVGILFICISIAVACVHTFGIMMIVSLSPGPTITIHHNNIFVFISFLIYSIFLFYTGYACCKHTADQQVRSARRDINKNYQGLIDYIVLAKKITSKDTTVLIDEYVNGTIKKL